MELASAKGGRTDKDIAFCSASGVGDSIQGSLNGCGVESPELAVVAGYRALRKQDDTSAGAGGGTYHVNDPLHVLVDCRAEHHLRGGDVEGIAAHGRLASAGGMVS